MSKRGGDVQEIRFASLSLRYSYDLVLVLVLVLGRHQVYAGSLVTPRGH